VRIGTWNVEYARGEEKNARRRALILGAEADIWVLTETHDDLDLRPTHVPISTTQRETGRLGGRWTTIWSRFPVLSVIPTRDPGRTVAALLQAPREQIVVFGTVLPWHSDRGPDGDARNWQEQYRVTGEQSEEWERLAHEFPDAALCVAGDLNMNLAGKHRYGTIKGRALLRDGFLRANLDCATSTVEGLSHAPIDHVVIDSARCGGTRTVAAWEGTHDGIRLSDHSAVVVEVPPLDTTV
jgi:hypothetical protein